MQSDEFFSLRDSVRGAYRGVLIDDVRVVCGIFIDHDCGCIAIVKNDMDR